MITTYAELKTAIPAWMYRDDIAEDTQAAEFIQLAEARLNRELDPVSTDATLTGTISSRRIDISSLSMETPIALFIKENGQENPISQRADGTFPYSDTNGKPQIWGLEGDNIDFDRPCDQAYTFRLSYNQRFALSDSATTNWLLTNHPDIYLAATMAWGRAYENDGRGVGQWLSILRTELPKIKRVIAASKVGTVRVDPMLVGGNGTQSVASLFS
jgi:hypothetical protein